jgi:indolepyruvate ferredoxin oxidoreductase
MKHAFRWLAKFKGLRGTALDPFGKTAERRMERALIDEYTTSIGDALARLTPETLPLVLELAALPERMRGFGHVKEANVAKAKARWAEIEAALAAAPATKRAAA